MKPENGRAEVNPELWNSERRTRILDCKIKGRRSGRTTFEDQVPTTA
jgi:hypothetical protein